MRTTKKKGIALVEMMVALAIFTLLVTSMMNIFTTLLRARNEASISQQRTEELSLTAGYVAKRMRMSDLGANCSGTICHIKDHESGNARVFDFSGNTFRDNGTVMVSDVMGGFSVTNSTGIPRITLYLMRIGHPETSVQTTVSLRSY